MSTGGNPMRRVTTGEPLRIPAQAYNGFIDAAIDFQRRQLGQFAGTGSLGRSQTIALVRNDAEVDVAPYEVLAITDALVEPVDGGDPGDLYRPQFVGKMPDADAHWSRFAVAMEGVPDGAIGRFAVAGVCLARVNIVDEGDEWCDLEDDETVLQSSALGSAQILWAEEGTGEGWALIRLGAAGRRVVPVEMVQSGGADGTDSGPATWTYTVRDLVTDNTVATDLSPVAAPHRHIRPSVGVMIPATTGLMVHGPDGPTLLWCNEVAEQEACPSEPEFES